MAEIAPFRAYRYDFQALGGDVSGRIAPPYDVLNEADKARLLKQDDRNIVAIDLPHMPPKALGPAECYEQAARTFDAWKADGTLVRENQPAMYVYHQTFTHDGTTYTRPIIFARLRLEPFSVGKVLPHESTFGGPKEDRLALMKATSSNLSPVFGLFRDPQNATGEAVASVVAGSPDAAATMGGVENRFWIISDDAIISKLQETLASENVYIADGHHRYTTSLNYCEWAIEQARGSLPEDHPARFVLIALASMDDPGNLILPTHRVLVETGGLTAGDLLAAWESGCEACGESEADLVVVGADGVNNPVRFSRRDKLGSLEPNKSEAWRNLDLAYLHRLLLEELLTPKLDGDPNIRYIKSEAKARKIAADENGLAILCKAPTMAEMRTVSESGDVMPQKSTYFYPKIATGLLINPLV